MTTQKQKNDLEKNIHKIRNTLVNIELDEDNIGLMNGKMGISIFLFYYSRVFSDKYSYNFAFKMLEDVLDFINDNNNSYTFGTGISGIIWGVTHLINNNFIDSDIDELLLDSYNYIFKSMALEMNYGNYDLLHGAIGNNLCFLARSNINSVLYNYLQESIILLEKVSVKDSNTFKWPSRLSKEREEIVFNLGLSHGIASIISYLSKLYKLGIYKDECERLLKGSVNYLLSNTLDRNKYISVFPSWVSDESPIYYSRLAWCYGDLGISVSLWLAGHSIKNTKWENTAKNILLLTSKRQNLSKNQVVDAGLCHGTAGIAHIFNRMYGYTGMEELKEASDYWFEQTLEMARFEDGLAGFKAWFGRNNWVNEPGLLEGIAGIGLAMISAVSDIEPAWDECLLLS